MDSDHLGRNIRVRSNLKLRINGGKVVEKLHIPSKVLPKEIDCPAIIWKSVLMALSVLAAYCKCLNSLSCSRFDERSPQASTVT
jgi:hypothetical protein